MYCRDEVARGFWNERSYFIGNKALADLDLLEMELCVEDPSTDQLTRLCIPLTASALPPPRPPHPSTSQKIG